MKIKNQARNPPEQGKTFILILCKTIRELIFWKQFSLAKSKENIQKYLKA
jgi:hypothetical protein